ncbi:E3 ubiquitin-protein ligase RNF8-like isoform X2 [Cydia fagiglandana]|uniref:E3 ubiquitin-protein ligase RNF8-like isoform X2 n=1 Tax=Cydia fagiglandana TaxID=1458189 RepID=UPI002FEDF81D
MEDQFPILCSSKPLKPEFVKFQRIAITSEDFKLGRGLQNSVVIPFVCLSRDHCVFKKIDDNWILEDCSSFGIEVNGNKLGKGQKRKLNNQDVIKLESSNEFVYKFVSTSEQSTPCKRRKLEVDENHDFIDNVKKKFEESQSCEIQHIEEKIQNAKHMQTTSKRLKEQLQLDLSRKEQQLHDDYAAQIKKLKGQHDEVEQQKALLIEERDLQLAAVKVEMEGKIASLMEQISKHNETESELIQENNALKDKLLKERDEFLSELNRESSSKQEMLDKLEARIREQEEVRLKEKKELEETLRRETEQLRLAKEKELKELEEQKLIREKELQEELNNIKNNLAKQIELHENEKRKAEQLLIQQKEQLQKLSDEEKSKIKQLIEERAEIEKKLAVAEADAGKSIQTLEEHVKKREIELSALAADRIQQQAEQSSEVISSLQAQLEKVRHQLQSVETEKKSLLESLTVTCVGEGSKSADVEDIIETELQCSICSELFINAMTLGCSHSFCKYCIDKWKKNKRECPICRTVITSECKSIVLDSLIERMMQTSEETKQKRQEILNARAAEVIQMTTPQPPARATTTGRARGRRRTTTRTTTTNMTGAPPTTTNTPSTYSSGAAGASSATTAATTRPAPIPTVDLTWIPTPPPPTRELRAVRLPATVPRGGMVLRGVAVAPPPPAVPLEAALRAYFQRPQGAPVPQVVHVVRMANGQLVRMAGGGAATSRGSRAPTTAATGAASAAAPAATGRPAAPTGNAPHPRPTQNHY